MIKDVLKRNINLFYVSAGIFMIATLLGSWLNMAVSDKTLVSPSSWMDLFLNNVMACGFIASGVFVFGISTVIFLITNGLIVGISLTQQVLSGMPIMVIFLKVIPHGFFELPAILLSGVIGLRGLLLIVNIYRDSQSSKKSLVFFLQDIVVIGCIILCLLFFAAFVEWYITP